MQKCLLLFSVIVLAACGGPGVKGDPARINDRHPLVTAGTRLALELFRKAAAGESGNIVFSPLSVQLALNMTSTGAGGETAAQLARLLGTAGQGREAVRQGSGDLLRSLADAAGAATLYIANSLWKMRGAPVRQDFLDGCRIYFGAPAEAVVFGGGEGQRRINGWIRKQTRGRIPAMLDKPFDSLTRMVLVGGIYFKGKWEKKFDRDNTADCPFWVKPGVPVTHPLMRVQDDFRYMENDRLQAVLLDYRGSALSLGVFLPAKNKTVDDFVSGLGADDLRRIVGMMRRRKGTVFLPRFRFSWGVKSFKEYLLQLGIPLAFDQDRADFTPLSPEKTLHIKDVLHMALVEVDEEGTTAAAATVVRTGIKSAPPPEDPFIFRADRPFVFCILDRRHGTILFLGMLRNPAVKH